MPLARPPAMAQNSKASFGVHRVRAVPRVAGISHLTRSLP